MARVWLQHVGKTSVTIGYALVASVHHIKTAQKNLQKQIPYKQHKAVKLMTADIPDRGGDGASDSALVVIAHGSSVLVMLNKTNRPIALPHQKRLQNLVRLGMLNDKLTDAAAFEFHMKAVIATGTPQPRKRHCSQLFLHLECGTRICQVPLLEISSS